MSPARPRSAAVLIALRTWLLPVALGAGAFALHYALHVPAGKLPPPSPAEAEEAKKLADKAKRDAERKQKEADRKAGKIPAAVPRSGARDLPYESFTRPRAEFLLAQLREYYNPQPFKKEPTFEAWQTAHKGLLGQIVGALRTLVLPAGPAITVASSECHTIRCRVTLSSPTPEALATIVATLETLELDGQPLWFSYKPGKVTLEAAKKGVDERHKQEITVIFQRDLPAMDHITAPGKGPLRPPPPPITPPTTPTGARPTTPTGPGNPFAPGQPHTLGGPGNKPGGPGRSSTAQPSPTGATAPEPDPTPK